MRRAMNAAPAAWLDGVGATYVSLGVWRNCVGVVTLLAAPTIAFVEVDMGSNLLGSSTRPPTSAAPRSDALPIGGVGSYPIWGEVADDPLDCDAAAEFATSGCN